MPVIDKPAEQIVIMLLGLLLICIYSLDRFNTPTSNRASTTAVRYYAAASAYVLIYLFAYFILLYYPYLVDLFLKIFVNDKVLPAEWAKTAPSTVIIAIILSVLIPKMPILAKADARLRNFLQSLAAIPYEALRLSKEIHDTPFSVPKNMQKKVEDDLKGRGFKEEDIVSDEGAASKHLWVKITALIFHLESWKKDTRFSAFAYERQDQFGRLQSRYKRLCGMAINCFSLLNQIMPGDTEDPMNQAVTKFSTNFMDEADSLFDEICNYVSQGVLKCKLTHGARCREIEDMGFAPTPDKTLHALSINHVLILSGILLIFLMLNFIVFFPAWEGHEKTLLMITMIGSIYSIAVICAIYPREWWAFFRQKPGKPMPVVGYLISGIAAVAISIPVSLLFKTLIFFMETPGPSNPFQKAWNHFAESSYPWMLMAFATVLIIGILVDSKQLRQLSENWRRWVEAGLQSIGSMAAALLVHWLLADIGPNADSAPERYRVLFVCGTIGFLIGAIVPSWYRRAHTRKEEEIEDPALPEKRILGTPIKL
jgi:hypothetical protein